MRGVATIDTISKTFAWEMALETGERLGMRCASPERTSNVDVGVAEMKIMRSLRLEESARECRLNRVNVAPGFFRVRRRSAATVFEAGALCDYHHE